MILSVNEKKALLKRQKELEEARKAGIAPAARDSNGQEINPHIPQYMTKGLWYLNQENTKTTLTHQKNWKADLSEKPLWFNRGAKVFQATKYRKSACKNCGAITHNYKNCFERPRRSGAKITNNSIAPDEKIESIHITNYEAKRDRWNGYETENYAKTVDKYNRIEQQAKKFVLAFNKLTKYWNYS